MTLAIEGGGGAGPFSRYPARPEAVQSAGDRIAAFAGDVESLHDAVTGTHRPAQQGVAGLLTMPMVAAEEPVRRKAQRWLGSALFAGGAVRLFSESVAEYNRHIDELNSRYWEARRTNFGVTEAVLAPDATPAERTDAYEDFRDSVATAEQDLLRELRNRFHRVVEPQLDDDADHVAGLLDRGPDDEEAVLALYSAGTLPGYAPVFFPQHDFSQVPLQNLPNGTLLAERMQRAMDGELPPEEFLEMMVWLEMMAGRIDYVQQHDNASLSEDELAFLHYFYQQMGERIWELPDYIAAEEHRWDGGGFNPWGWRDERSDGFDQATQERMLGALGTGLLGLSNNELWPPHLRGQDPMDPQSRYHLPQTVIDLVSQPALDGQQTMQYPHLGPLVDRLDDFAKLSTMFAHVPDGVEGGTRFSELTTQRVAELAFAAQMYQDGGFTPGLMTGSPLVNTEAVSAILEPLLEVSTRNEEANHRLLTGEGLGPMERISLKHPDPGYHHYDDQAFLLNALYGFQWSDDGAAAAGLTDWISVRADEAARNGEYDPMATEAAAALIETVTSIETNVNNYDTLMRSLSEHNPEIARSFGRIGGSYLEDFSLPAVGTETGVITDADGNVIGLGLSSHAMTHFFDLVATDDQAINGLSTAFGEYEHRMLAAQLADGTDEGELTRVARRLSQLDGLIQASRVNAITVGAAQNYSDEIAAFEEHMRHVDLGRRLAMVPIGKTGPIGTTGLGYVVDQIISGTIQPPQPVDYYAGPDIRNEQRDNIYSAHTYLTVKIYLGEVDPAELPADLITEDSDGNPVLRPISEIHNRLQDELNDAAFDAGGTEFRDYENGYKAHETFRNNAAETVEDAEKRRQGAPHV